LALQSLQMSSRVEDRDAQRLKAQLAAVASAAEMTVFA